MLGWSTFVLARLPYNLLRRSAHLYGQFFLDKNMDLTTLIPGTARTYPSFLFLWWLCFLSDDLCEGGALTQETVGTGWQFNGTFLA